MLRVVEGVEKLGTEFNPGTAILRCDLTCPPKSLRLKAYGSGSDELTGGNRDHTLFTALLGSSKEITSGRSVGRICED